MEEKVLGSFRPCTGRWLVGSFDGLITLGLCLLLIGLPFVALVWLQRRFTTYTITNQRIVVATGVIFKRIDEIELYRIKDVRVNFSLLNQIVNIGSITLSSSDKTTRARGFKISPIHNARKIREGLRNLVEAARQKRGVREFDAPGHFVDQVYH